MMTFLDLVRRVHLEAGLAGDGASSVLNQNGMDGSIVNWVQAAYQDIILMRNWDFMWRRASITVPAGTTNIKFSDYGINGVGQIVATQVWLTSVNPRVQLVFDDQYKLEAQFYGVANGTPSYFTRLPDDSMQLFPTPDATVTIQFDYYKNYQPMVSNTDIPAIPERYHMMIVYRALMKYGAYDDDAGTFQDARQNFETFMYKMDAEQRSPLTKGLFPLTSAGFGTETLHIDYSLV